MNGKVKTFFVTSETDKDIVREVNVFLQENISVKSVVITPIFKTGYSQPFAWYGFIWYE